MKKIISMIVVAVMLICAMSVMASAEVKYLGEADVPYATKAPVIDGVLGDEWKNAAKYTMTADNTTVVAGPKPTGLVVNVYLLWDEDNLYVAYEVTDPTHGPLIYGADGDHCRLFMDFDNVAQTGTNPNQNCHNLSIGMFPVVSPSDKTKATGVHSWVNANVTYDEGSDSVNPLNNVAASINGNTWYGEQRVAWSKLREIAKAQYAKDFEPKAGMPISFMPWYHDCDENNRGIGDYIGQNEGFSYVDGNGQTVTVTSPWAISPCFGFRGALAAKAEAPATGDLTSLAVVVASIAAAAVIVGFKKH